MQNPVIYLFRLMWRYSAGNRSFVILFIGMSIIANIIGLMEPLVIGRIFNDIQFAATTPALMYSVIGKFGLLILITLGFWIFHGISRVIESRNAFMVRKNYKTQAMQKILDLPAEWHRDHHSGDTIDKIDKASESLFDFSAGVFLVVQTMVKLVGATTILFFFDWRATLIALVISVITLSLLTLFDKKLKITYDAIFKYENSLAAGIHDYIANIVTVITLRLKPRVIKEVTARSSKAYPDFKNNTVTNEFKWFSANMMITLMVVLVLVLYSYRSFSVTGFILIGTLFTLYRYLDTVGNTFYDFAWRYNEIFRQHRKVLAAEALGDALIKQPTYEEYFLPKDWQTIQIKKLSFSYTSSENAKKREHIKNISLTLTRGQRVAFIGESGSGKSTVLSLLRGLYKARRGEVFADGKRQPHSMANLYGNTTLIPQDPEIFQTSIRDNITMGMQVSEELLNQAIDLAQFTSVVNRVPRGLKSSVMEKGVSLSGGEKQRLALARGLVAVKDTSLILMDEPTSSVDITNELSIYQNIFQHFKDHTIISSIHRLHLLRYFDYIYLFSNGAIVAEGSFNVLLEEPLFKEFWERYEKHVAV